MAISTSTNAQADINVTPLIDVLLVLLIILMVIVPVSPRGLESRVPKTANADKQPTLGPVTLHVLTSIASDRVPIPRYEVDGRIVERQQLGATLFATLRVRADRTVFVAASPELSYGDIATAIGAAKAAGASTIALGHL